MGLLQINLFTRLFEKITKVVFSKQNRRRIASGAAQVYLIRSAARKRILLEFGQKFLIFNGPIMKIFKNFFPAAFFIIFLCTVFSSQASNFKRFPSLTVEQIDGKIFDLSKLRGKVVLINFWAVWCKDCRNEMPVLDEIYRAYHDKGLEMIAVSIDRKKDRENVLKLAKDVSYPIAMLIDAKNNNFSLPTTIPTAYFIDKNGKIVAQLMINESKITKEDFEKILLPLL